MLSTSLATLAREFLVYAVVPLWIAGAFADWLCHRRSRIESTSGLPESALHALMLVELGVPTLLAVFFEINALVVACLLAGFVIHELTVYVDLRYASARRPITPGEQMVHSLLEGLPVVAAVLVFLLNGEAVLSLFGRSRWPAEFELHLEPPPLPLAGLAAFAAAGLLFVLLPAVEELWRCWRAGARPPPAAGGGRRSPS